MFIAKIYRLIVVFGISFCCAQCASHDKTAPIGTMTNSDFAFVIDYSEEQKTSKPYLVGQFQPGTQVTLLRVGQAKTCSAKTTAHTEVSLSSEANFTEITGLCGDAKSYRLAVLEKQVREYTPINLNIVEDPRVVTATIESIRNDKALHNLRMKAQDLIPGDIEELNEITPEIYQFFMPGAEIKVVSYEKGLFEKEGISGPRVIVINGGIYALTGWCSYKQFNVFRLNGEYYIETGSGCCGCGITIMELFKVRTDGLVEVYSDYSLSD